jgi:hypothetical protein
MNLQDFSFEYNNETNDIYFKGDFYNNDNEFLLSFGDLGDGIGAWSSDIFKLLDLQIQRDVILDVIFEIVKKKIEQNA